MFLELIQTYYPQILRIFFEIVIVFIIIQFFRNKNEILKFSNEKIEQMVLNFSPLPLINMETINRVTYDYGAMKEMADFDFYNIKDMFKDQIKDTIWQYGVGTCGPPGFYGTLDLHLDLEKKISQLVGTESAILYSNSFTCVNSLITCFCKFGDIVFFHKSCNEAILRGLYASRSEPIEFDMLNLEQKLERFWNEKKRNFLIIEGIFKNTGEIVNMKTITKLKKKYPFHLIVDESLSIPIFTKKGISHLFKLNHNDIDIRIGSFSHIFCAVGGFVASNKHITDYQRLLAPAYCFSASMPGYLTKFILMALDLQYKHFYFEEVHEEFKSNSFMITSHVDCPFIVVVMTDSGRKKALQDLILEDKELKEENVENQELNKSINHGNESFESEIQESKNTIPATHTTNQDLKDQILKEVKKDKSQQIIEENKTNETADNLSTQLSRTLIVKEGNDEQDRKKDAKRKVSFADDQQDLSNESIEQDKQFATNKANLNEKSKYHNQNHENKNTESEKNTTQNNFTQNDPILTINQLRKNLTTSTIRLSKILSEFDLTSSTLENKQTKKINTDTKINKNRVCELLTIENKIQEFKKNGFRVGFIYNPKPGIRFCLKNDMKKADLRNLIENMNRILK